MLVGYARVSTSGQDIALQRDALIAAGCTADHIFTDLGVSGAKAERPGLTKALDFVRAGDVLVVWKLDRLGRSMGHLIETVNTLAKRDIGFRSLTENLDATTPATRLMFLVL